MDIHNYQVRLVGILFFVLIIFYTLTGALAQFGTQNDTADWIVTIFLIIIGTLIALKFRTGIFSAESRKITWWTFILWALLGFMLIKWHYNLRVDLDPIDAIFLISTILIADSYWDFKDISRMHEK